MELAKSHLDVGLYTHDYAAQAAFWRDQVGLAYDHMGKLGGGVQQHRYHANGSIIKVNHARDPLPAHSAGGIAGVRIARSGLQARQACVDPDGNRVTLVPSGEDGVVGIAIELVVADRDAHDRFWCHVMQFDALGSGRYRCGDTLVVVVGQAKVQRPEHMKLRGWRYITVQIRDCVAEHAGALARGGEEELPPRLLGETVRYSLVRDPDGNFIELSQRASLVGSLDAAA